jgi:trimethylamine---corrinoid protein Co-methyltransferase
MRPQLELLAKPLIERILEEAFYLIEDPGVRGAPYVIDLLRADGVTVKDGIAHIPEPLARRLLDLVPRGFCLYDRSGKPAVGYGGDDVNFDPGSSCLNVLDPQTQQARPAMSADLVRLVQIAEMLPQFAAQSTAMLCNDVPQEIGDWYRLLLVLWYSEKPVVTGAFSAQLARARNRVGELISSYERQALAPEIQQEMMAFAEREAKKAGLETLPEISPEHGRKPGLI